MVAILIFSIYNGGMAGAIFNYGLYPRSLGMGKAFCAVGGDVEAGYYNPAGLITLKSNDLRVAHQTLYGGGRLEYLGYSFPTKHYGSFGFTIINHGLEGFYSFDENLQSYTSFSFSQNCLIFSYSYPIGNFFGFGLNLKGISSKLAQYADFGFGGDLGIFLFPRESFSFGVMVHNLLPPRLTMNEKTDVFPNIFRFGGSLRFYDNRILIAADGAQPIGYELNPHFGIEFVAIPRALTLRAGVDGNELSFGGGFKWTYGRLAFGLDYAMLMHHAFNYLPANTHKLGLHIQFGGFRVWLKAKPKIFSPSPLHRENVLWIDLHIHAQRPVKRWQLLIRNELGEVVRTFSSWGEPPKRLTWDGLDDVGRSVSDGDYYYELVVIDERDDVLKYDDFLTTIKTIGPEGELETIPEK
ncbi:hypothetical protein DRP53_00525 [candidate division WOR-3 bacterium]|uniref:PorV/PorQ family protein n=1 Tax=candidate division WOR-3 bacterium TaxID=2052148 RepID=A0A660SLW0_UNCW3|nr:MAG: hypothetical protein DRP53_00525 [candidate division WOR-3 bacterium]